MRHGDMQKKGKEEDEEGKETAAAAAADAVRQLFREIAWAG